MYTLKKAIPIDNLSVNVQYLKEFKRGDKNIKSSEWWTFTTSS